MSRERHVRRRHHLSPRHASHAPNVALMIADDQGECHYGHAVEIRSTQTGPPT